MPKNLLTIITTILILISFTSIAFGQHLYILDLFSHFQLQYLSIATILFIISIIKHNYYIPLIIFLYFSLITSFYITPVSFVPDNITEPKLYYINSYYYNKNTKQISDNIKSVNPATVAVVEINQELYDELTKIYGKSVTSHNQTTQSCAIFSKRDLIEAKLITETEYPICYAEFEDYILYLVHPLPPLGRNLYSKQQKHFEDITKLVNASQSTGKRVVIAGDFNSTYYAGGFRNHFGNYFKKNYYTWNTDSTLSIPIDHIFSNYDIRVAKGEKLSSDHNGLVADF